MHAPAFKLGNSTDATGRCQLTKHLSVNPPKKLAWKFATIAFQPYPDVGEFVNVGAIAVAVAAPVFAWRLLLPETTQRIEQFFPELDIAIYGEGRARLETELRRLHWSPDAETVFKSLTRPGDGLFRFHAKGTRFAADSVSLLEAIFRRYVDRRMTKPHSAH